MNNDQNVRLPFALATASILLASLSAGCGKSEIQTYRVAKDTEPPPNIAAHGHGAESQRPEPPHVHSDVPAGWQQIQPEGMRVAAYQITGDNGKTAQVAIIPLPGARDIALESVNMWRTELGLKPLEADQLKDATQPAELGDAQGILVDMAAESAGPTGLN